MQRLDSEHRSAAFSSRVWRRAVTVVRWALVPLALFVTLGAMSRSSSRRAPAVARAATGRIEGDVVISKSLTARRARFRIYAGDGAAALPPARDTVDERHNVIIYLTSSATPPDDAGATVADDRAKIRQLGERFVPHVVPVRRGSTVEFPNDDPVFHNVFSLSTAKAFDLGRYPRGASKSLTFDRAGVVQVFCHIHADMSAIILVLDTPLFARPDSTGRFVLDGVPPGDYTIVGWHERIRPVTRVVHVEAGRTSAVDFNIPLPSGDGRER